MNQRDADQELDGANLVPVLTGSMDYAKEVLGKCLNADIPAILGCPADTGKS